VTAFPALLAGYRVQPLGPPALDPFVDSRALDDLPAALGRYIAARDAASDTPPARTR
jgi:hypothetical protein